MGFYLAPSSAVYFSVFSFYLTYCVWGLLFTGCRFIVPVVFGVVTLPVGKVDSVGCVGFLLEGIGACVLVDEAESCLSSGRTTSAGVFLGVCELFMILGSLSANGWGCFPVLLVVWYSVFSTVACWSLSGGGS